VTPTNIYQMLHECNDCYSSEGIIPIIIVGFQFR